MYYDTCDCPKGQRVLQACTETQVVNCGECPNQTYSDTLSDDTECIDCSDCKMKEIKLRNCTRQVDTTCKCPPGYRYSKHDPCRKCEPDEIVVNNKCVKRRASSPAPDITGPYRHDNYLVITIAISVTAILLLMIMVCTCCYYRKKKRTPQVLNRAPQVYETLVRDIHLKHPDDTHYSYNDYVPAPRQQRLPLFYNPHQELLLKHVITTEISSELVNALCLNLGRSHRINYSHVAGQMDFTMREIAENIEHRDKPVQNLMSYLASQGNITFRRLCDVLVSLGRTDVVHLIIRHLEDDRVT